MKTREKLWRLYKRRCSLCGRFMLLEDVTKDHIIPKSKGGINHITNYAPAHGSCNTQKGNKIRNQYVIKQNPVKKKIKNKPLTGITIEERWLILFGEKLPSK